MHAKDAKFDYLKFMFRTDPDQLQDNYYTEWARLLRKIDVSPTDTKICDFTALGRGVDGLNRYVCEIWGPKAEELSKHAPISWLNNLRRIDMRWELSDLNKQQVEDIQLAYAMASKKRRPNFFNTPPRKKKKETRDVGGTGLQWGSKKSRRHCVVYKRGQERLAYEFRLKDEAARDCGMQALATAMVMQISEFADALRIDFDLWQEEWEREFFDGDVSKKMWAMASVGRKLREKGEELAEFAETDEERAFWSELTAEQQLELQGLTVEPTPKGWVDTPRRNNDVDGLGGRAIHDEDLPF